MKTENWNWKNWYRWTIHRGGERERERVKGVWWEGRVCFFIYIFFVEEIEKYLSICRCSCFCCMICCIVSQLLIIVVHFFIFILQLLTFEYVRLWWNADGFLKLNWFFCCMLVCNILFAVAPRLSEVAIWIEICCPFCMLMILTIKLIVNCPQFSEKKWMFLCNENNQRETYCCSPLSRRSNFTLFPRIKMDSRTEKQRTFCSHWSFSVVYIFKWNNCIYSVIMESIKISFDDKRNKNCRRNELSFKLSINTSSLQ